MSRSTLRRIRRLRAASAPVIHRRENKWEESLPSLAHDHLLSVIALFQYGEPRGGDYFRPIYMI